jgi:hypothetical protein
MKKFNQMESDLLVSSLRAYVANLESEIEQMEKDGKRSIFASGFYTMISNELVDKVRDMTKKPKKI